MALVVSPADESLSAVLRTMARACNAADVAVRVGEFTLRAAQRSALRAVERALAEYGGALVADAPGSGKTVLALAVAAKYGDCLVIAPATLREQWTRAAARAGVALRVVSIEALSAGQQPAPAALIVLDEAHQLRSTGTRRYRALAALAMHRHLLLLTATPVVNSVRDRDALLALFLGERADALSDAQRARVMLRLATAESPSHPVRRIAPLPTLAALPGIAEALQALPPPLPLADGEAATAMLRTSLAFAWASSLAALDAALARRLSRGRVLDDELAAGHWPSRASLRDYLFGDDATQLSFGFAMDPREPVPTEARATLALHLRAVAALRERVRPQVAADATRRAEALLALSARHPGERIVLFAQSAATVRALFAAMRHAPGVLGIVGQRVLAAAGRWSRDEVLASLGSAAQEYDPRDVRGIRILLATDVLAEGAELQAASIVVHGDPTWTPARLEQREGRVAREGQRRQVLVTRFRVPEAADAMLKVRERLARKAAARVSAMQASAARAQLAKRVAALSNAAALRAIEEGAGRVAALQHAHCGFLALLREGGSSMLVAGEFRAGQWCVTENPRAVTRALPRRLTRSARLQPAHLACVRRVLRAWQRRRLGAAAARDAASLPHSVLRELRRRLDGHIEAAPLAARATVSREVGDVLQGLASLRGRGVEQTLRAELRRTQSEAQLLDRLRDVLRAAPLATSGPASAPAVPRLEALLILVAAQADAKTAQQHPAGGRT